MFKAIAVVGISALILGGILSSPLDAKKRKKTPEDRKVELPYTEPAVGTAGLGVCFQGSSCLFFGTPRPKERFFSVEVKDAFDTTVYGSVIQDTNEDGNFLAADDLTVGFCGSTEYPIEIEPGKDVSVWVWQGPGLDPPCPGMASSGTATATFLTK